MYFQRGNPVKDRNVQRKLDGSVVQFFEKKTGFRAEAKATVWETENVRVFLSMVSRSKDLTYHL
jgi:nucleoside diphosphate kinase